MNYQERATRQEWAKARADAYLLILDAQDTYDEIVRKETKMQMLKAFHHGLDATMAIASADAYARNLPEVREALTAVRTATRQFEIVDKCGPEAW